MADVQIGLGPVLSHEDLTMLERIHRAGIDIEIGIELLHRDAQSARHEQATEA